MLLIDLHNALLLGSQLSAPTQLALTVTLKAELLRQSQSNAVLLLWLAGSTSKQTPEQQQQLQALLQAGVLQTLVKLLPDVDHCSSSTAALIECISRLAAPSTAPQLAAVWEDPANLTNMMTASCSSEAAGKAAAALLVLALGRGLPAAKLLQPLLPRSDSLLQQLQAAAARRWVANAMPPLLQQLQQQLVSLQETAAGPLAQLQMSPVRQELWQLLLNVAAVAQAAGPSASLSSLEQFFGSQPVNAAMQAAMLDRTTPAVQLAVVQILSKLAGMTAELARCCFTAVAPSVAGLMAMGSLTHSAIGIGGGSSSISAADAVGDARQQQLTGQEQAAPAAVQVAVRDMWVLLLKRVNCYQQLAAEAARQLPLAAAAVASAAPSLMACQSCLQTAHSSSSEPNLPRWSGSFSVAEIAQVAVFVPLAVRSSCYSRPLLQHQQQLTVALLLPHVDSLTQVLTAAPAAMAALKQQQNHDQVELPALAHLQSVVPLTLWMLHSFAEAIHHQQQLQHPVVRQLFKLPQDHAAPPAVPASSWEGMLAAVSALLKNDSGGLSNFERASQWHMHTAALELARCLLPHVPMDCTESDGQPAACSSAWRGVVAAVVERVTKSAAQPLVLITMMEPALVACKLAHDIAKQAPQLLLEPTGPKLISGDNSSNSSSSSSSRSHMGASTHSAAIAAAAEASFTFGGGLASNSSSSSKGEASGSSTSCHAQQLAVALRTLLGSLRRRKLERSSSGQELLEVVDDALAAVQRAMAGR